MLPQKLKQKEENRGKQDKKRGQGEGRRENHILGIVTM